FTSLYESTFNENDYYEYLDKKLSVIAKNLDMVDNKIIVKVPSLEMMKYKRINLELWNKSEYELIINKIEMKNRFSFHYSSADWHPLPFKGKDKTQTFSSIR
ncbi:hypothetical protein, partial [Paenibacillus phytohabitans]|uniref:hypothetical protein n=1 Tax=Paenibacillus phytohabitans TaxID=2654978 RepID=UPI00300B4246